MMNTGSDGTDVPQPDKSTIDTSTKGVTLQLILTRPVPARGLYSCKLHELLLLEMPRECQLDGGSQLSYVIKSLQEHLGLKPIQQEKLCVNTFGSSAFVANQCDIIKVPIQSPYSN